MLIAKKKLPPSNSLPFLIKLYQDVFSALANAPKNYPDILTTGLPGKRIYLINHPDLAKHVLLKNVHNYAHIKTSELMHLIAGDGLPNVDDQNWKKHRMLVQPVYHMERLKKISETVTTSTNQLLRGWKTKLNTTINFTHELKGLVNDFVVKSVFSEDVIPGLVETMLPRLNFLGKVGDGKFGKLLFIPLSIPTSEHRQMRKYINELDTIIFDIINKRRKAGSPRADLLQMLMDAHYPETGVSLTDKQIRDEVMVLFMTGYETTVNAISWTWYLLKKSGNEEEKLREESLRFAKSRNPVFEDLPHMIFGKQVINEGLRMFPPAAGIAKDIIEDDEMGSYYVSAGIKAIVNIAGLHYHPDYWQTPYKFSPGRFENFDTNGASRFMFLPFGGGPRMCIGKNFAMMEMQLINAILSARVDMELVSKDIKPETLLTTKPGKGVLMQLKKVTVDA